MGFDGAADAPAVEGDGGRLLQLHRRLYGTGSRRVGRAGQKQQNSFIASNDARYPGISHDI